MSTPTLAQLKQALTLAEQIERLQAELAWLIGNSPSAIAVTTASPAKGGRRNISAATIAKMKASQQARWAKKKGASLGVVSPLDMLDSFPKGKASKPAKKKGKLSPEGRARIVAALKARWAAKKKAK